MPKKLNDKEKKARFTTAKKETAVANSLMSYSSAMLDFETLSTQPNAVVLSVGLVLFDLEGDDTSETIEADESRNFFATIEFQSQIDAGRHIDANTIMWWMQQNRSAQKETFNEKGRMSVEEMLEKMLPLIGKKRLMGNGASFDNPILATLCTDFGFEPPPFWMARDLRTLQDLSQNEKLPNRGVAHSALADAQYQVLCAQEYYGGL